MLNRRLGPYVLVKELAVGGMAQLFLALKIGPGPFEKPVVIKCILPEYNQDSEYVELFYKEAALTALFQHPNVIHTYDADIDQGLHYMVMEHLLGVTVAELMEKDKALGHLIPRDLWVQLIIDAAEGLHYVHSLKDHHGAPIQIVHRDISPQNIFVTDHGQIKVFDFGIAQMHRPEQSGVLVGKYAYMSPEQCRGEVLDARSDIFSLAVVLYELTTGRRLFQRPNLVKTIRAITEEPIPKPSSWVSDYPKALEQVVMKGLAKNLEERPINALEWASMLRKYQSSTGINPTSRELSAYVEIFFAERWKAFHHTIIEARQQIEAKYGRVDPHAYIVEEREEEPSKTIDPMVLQSLVLTTPEEEPKPEPKRTGFNVMPWLLGGAAALMLGLFWGIYAGQLWHPQSSEKSSKLYLASSAVREVHGFHLTLDSIPSGAEIWIDGQNTHFKTPAKIRALEKESFFKVQLFFHGKSVYEEWIAPPQPGAELVWIVDFNKKFSDIRDVKVKD